MVGWIIASILFWIMAGVCVWMLWMVREMWTDSHTTFDRCLAAFVILVVLGLGAGMGIGGYCTGYEAYILAVSDTANEDVTVVSASTYTETIMITTYIQVGDVQVPQYHWIPCAYTDVTVREYPGTTFKISGHHGWKNGTTVVLTKYLLKGKWVRSDLNAK